MTRIMKLIFNLLRGKWPDELIKVMWSHNTMMSRSTGFTPFKLLFGDKAITPEEAKAGSIRTVASAKDEADYSVAKDAIEGIRLQAVENINKYQARALGTSESCQPRYSRQATVEVGRTFSGNIFVKTRFLQIEGYGRQRHS
jgi:hypothetical protein